MNIAARLLLALVWLLHLLPLGLQAALGRALGRLMHALAHGRRRVALRNVALCLPELSAAAQQALVREHFQWLARSLLERGLLWYASRARLERLIRVEGDVHLAERSERPVMWLVPHFLAVDVAGAATQLFQTRRVCNVYTAQSNGVLDAALLRGRGRFGLADMFTRQQSALPMVRAIKRGSAFFNPSDMDFGLRDAAFVPFFGHPAATLLAPSRLARSLAMVVQPVVAEILPGGQGWRVRFLEPWSDWPSDDAEADAARMNAWIEQQIRALPAQYLWVHKRFKTRPPGEPPFYA
ncbi:Lipid A biosynthesis lauroyl acyltransferase [Rubrivivax sp. A210]|uniref:LpxL/LpxP family acyltransferase n=1 Tax=Rubrivivax sp. A210 TaxID=2772301 RepID=UPI00191AD93D|nr:lipid A biosynthesis acyltransferase [Rubrivivax sp. A210]CAD5374216.1 Lipid A biosynthesis lauroyl acyltransferase [Rubrivivax sp. A210]